MMLMSAVLAVALGLTPATETKSRQLIQVDDRTISELGRYKQYVGKDGKTHLRGFDRIGRPYDVAIDAKGHVEAQVGDWYSTFDVADAS